MGRLLLKIRISRKEIIKQAEGSRDLQIDNLRGESSPYSHRANKARAEEIQALTKCCNVGPGLLRFRLG